MMILWCDYEITRWRRISKNAREVKVRENEQAIFIHSFIIIFEFSIQKEQEV